MKLQPNELDLVGNWNTKGKTVMNDSVSERIEWLTKSVLKQIAHSKQWGAWQILFQDTEDGRFWERTYPQGDTQGGGPPRLTCISREQAEARYFLGEAKNSGNH